MHPYRIITRNGRGNSSDGNGNYIGNRDHRAVPVAATASRVTVMVKNENGSGNTACNNGNVTSTAVTETTRCTPFVALPVTAGVTAVTQAETISVTVIIAVTVAVTA